MVFDKMAAIRPDFKWLGFWISDPIQKSRPFETQPVLDHSKSRLSDFRSPLYVEEKCVDIEIVLHLSILVYNFGTNCMGLLCIIC